MQTQHVPDISNLITSDGCFKDAIHVAVCPVQAGCWLVPGEKIKLVDGLAVAVESAVEESIGVVSPFLKQNVQKGEWFYCLINPGTVQNLRHAWSLSNFNPKRRAGGESD